MKKFLFMLFCLTATFLNVNAVEFEDYKSNEFSNCITVNHDQIYITEDGIFAQVGMDFIPVRTINFRGINEYECHLDFHENIHLYVYCSYCGRRYDGIQYSQCPDPDCIGNMH